MIHASWSVYHSQVPSYCLSGQSWNECTSMFMFGLTFFTSSALYMFQCMWHVTVPRIHMIHHSLVPSQILYIFGTLFISNKLKLWNFASKRIEQKINRKSNKDKRLNSTRLTGRLQPIWKEIKSKAKFDIWFMTL